MLLYNIEKFDIHNTELDIQNIFTDDEIYFYGFKPNSDDIKIISRFITDLNYYTFLSDPISLYLSKSDHLYLAELKIFNSIEPIFVSCQSNTLEDIVSKLKMDLKNESVYPIYEDQTHYHPITKTA